MPLPEGVVLASELVMTIVQAYVLAQKAEGKTNEQAIAEFPLLCEKFLKESENPIDPVKT